MSDLDLDAIEERVRRGGSRELRSIIRDGLALIDEVRRLQAENDQLSRDLWNASKRSA
jgi:hypothetical protein